MSTNGARGVWMWQYGPLSVNVTPANVAANDAVMKADVEYFQYINASKATYDREW